MTREFKVGDRVRIRNGHRFFQVIEVDPVGSGSPAPPATYLVRIKLPEGGPDLVYGDTALIRAPS